MLLKDLRQAMRCECCSQEIDFLHDVVAASDAMVAKALMISDVARIARTEVRMREYMLAKWRIRADQAAARAGAIVASGGSLKSAFKAVDSIMRRWAKEVSSRYEADITEIYRSARLAGWKKASGKTKASLQYQVPNFTEELAKIKKAKTVAAVKPTFDLADEKAVAQLHNDQMLWIGDHYDRNVRDTVRTSVKPGVAEGVSRNEAGKRVQEAVSEQLRKVTVPKGFNGSDAKYFEGLAANTATNARVRGQMRSFTDVGVTRYEIVNPMDDRTSQICAYMNGQVFTISEGVAQIESTAGATTPEQVKAAHPWLPFKKVSAITGGARGLAKAGLALPPYHFRCRSTIDIASESTSFRFLTDD